MDEIIFLIFRLGSAIVLTGVSVYISWKMVKRDLMPRPVWLYVSTIMWAVSLFRWFVVWLVYESGPVYEGWEPWLQPITQAMYVLLAMAIFVLTFTHIKERRLHYQREHDEYLDAE